jgi:hypothetical protein
VIVFGATDGGIGAGVVIVALPVLFDTRNSPNGLLRQSVLLTISTRFEHSPLIGGSHARNSAIDSLFEDTIPEHVSFCLTTL